VTDLKWMKVEALFQELSLLGEQEREVLLTRWEKWDPAIAAEALALFEAGQEAESFVEVSEELASFGMGGGETAPGKRLGAYRILHRLGSGGTSNVYLAVRDDGTYHRHVAVKLLNSGFQDSEFLKMFYREQQILAGLNHPNIAKILDAGHTERGLPYLVTEYVEGVALDQFCKSNHFGIQEILNLFFKVCEAVSYAHQNLIIHRDLKPGNILVNASGEPILLDFGFAKMLNPNFCDKAAASQVWMRMLTPAYASPEQFLGKGMTTASDIYSLGVILYELLTHQKPRHFEGMDFAQIEKLFNERHPLRPSQMVKEAPTKVGSEFTSVHHRVNPERRVRQLRGDLDAILLKTLRVEPQRRYASVGELVQDIGNYISRRPVKARKNSFFYRNGKFLNRNKGILAVAGAFLVLGSLFVFYQSRQARHLAAAFEKARIAQQNTEEAFVFLGDLFQLSDPMELHEGTLSARDFLNRAADRIFENLGNQPLQKTKMMAHVGQIYVNLGMFQEAINLMERGLTIAQDERVPENDQVSFEHLFGTALLGKGEVDAALVHLNQAYSRKVKLLGTDDPDLAKCLYPLGKAASDLGDYDAAKLKLERALELLRQKSERRDELEYKIIPVLADLDVKFNNHDVAIARLLDLLASAQSDFGDHHPTTAGVAAHLGLAFKRKGMHDEAEKYYRWALEKTEARLGSSHPMLAAGMVNLGALLQDRGMEKEAEALYLKALEIYDGSLVKDHPEVFTTRSNLATLYYQAKDYQKAANQMEIVLESQARVLGVGHPDVCRTRANLAMIRNRQGDRSMAEMYLRQNIAMLSEKQLTQHDMYSLSLQNLGSVLTSQSSYKAALPFLTEADAMMRQKGVKSLHFANNLCRLGFVYSQEGQPDRAIEIFEEAHSVLKNILTSENPRWRLLALYHGIAEFERKDFELASSLILQNIDEVRTFLGAQNNVVRRAERILDKLNQPLAMHHRPNPQ